MFMGEYHHTIDEKGRIIIPSKLREELGEEFIVTKGLDGCLFIYPKEEWNNIAQNTAEYCQKGDIVGVKGRVQSSSYEKDGEKKFSVDIVAEKVTFLSSKSKNEPESER